MTKKKVYLILQSALCLLLTALLAAGAVGIYREGAAQRAAGDPFAPIYTREKIAARFAPVAPLFLAAVAMTLAGLILGVRDDRADRRGRRGIEAPHAERTAGRAGRGILALRIVLAAMAAGFIVAGALNGGARDVLVKAIYICTECVGLG